MPKALAVTFSVGGACWRLYSAAFTMRTVRRTRIRVKVQESDGNFIRTPILFNIGLEDGIEHIVRRQGILIRLVGPKLRRGSLVEAGLRNAFFFAVNVARDGVDSGLGNVGDDGKSPRHVPVKGAIADRQLGFIARGQQERSELVGERHQNVAANPRLDVFFRHIARCVAKCGVERMQVAFENRRNRNDLKFDSQVACQSLGIPNAA